MARRRLAFAGVRADTSPGTIRARSPPAACCPGVPVESGVVGTLARLARKGVASPAGRSIEARGEERRGVRASRAHAARTTSVARLGAQGGTMLARPAAVGIVARRPPDAAPRCTSPRSGARRRTCVRPSRRRGRSRAAAGSGPWRRPGRRSSRAPRARPCRPRAGCSRALSAWRAPFPCPRPPAGPPSCHPSGSPRTLRLPCLPPPRRWWKASRAWQRLRLN